MEFTPRNDREMAMLVARIGGANLEQIGQEFGITRERARQILQRMGWRDARTGKSLGIVRWYGKPAEEANTQRGGGRLLRRLRRDSARRESDRAERLRHIALIRDLAKNNRVVTYAMMAKADGVDPANTATHYGQYWTKAQSFGNATKRLFRLAGVRPPTKGWNG